MESRSSAIEELYGEVDGKNGGRMVRRRHADDDELAVYKSKNLEAERKRREKLSSRLLELRSLVPIITNMNKATIITDAITYITNLQNCVKDLTEQLLQIETRTACCHELESRTESVQVEGTQEMKRWISAEPSAQVAQIDGNRVWLKIVIEKKIGGFTKLMGALTDLGFQLNDMMVTTCKGALLFTSCLQGNRGEMIEAKEIRDLLEEMIQGI